MTYSTVTEVKQADRNPYGELIVNFQEAINVAYPEITFTSHTPGCWGGNPDIWINGNELNVPDGRYSSSKHKHTAGHGILAIENARECKLNLAGNPLFLLTGRAFNGDYRSLTKTYFLFGRNEDKSFFLHKIRPSAAKTGDLDACRNWMWSIKKSEKVSARQGDLGFVIRESGKPSGKAIESKLLTFGNHKVLAEEWRCTADRYFARNAIAQHGEHHTIRVEGWSEIRLAKAWGSSTAD